MHEMGIAMQIIKIAVDSIPESMKGNKVKSVNISVGKLSTIVPDSLKFCFDIAVRDTPVEGACLVINEIPVIAECNDCNITWEIETPAFSCNKCGATDISLKSGRELDINSIEIDD